MVLGGTAAVAVGALFLSACSNGSSTTASTSTSTSTSVRPGSTTTGGAGSGSSTTSPASGAAQNLVATAALKTALTAAFVAHRGLPASEVAGTAPNSVYYGYVPSTSTYWAVAGFVPTANASYNTQVAMQDEGCCGIFTMTAGGSWTYVAGYLGAPCTGQVPAALEQLWNLTPPGDCSPGTTTTTS
jgi:cytoskeletal protein RodZ